MQNNLRSKDGLAPLAVAISLALAVAAAPAGAETTAASLTRIEAETLVLKAREKQLEVQSSIIAKQNEIAAKQSMGAQITQTAVVGNPVVLAIEGVGGALYATLQMADGSAVDVQGGSVLADGMRIVSIKPNEVVAVSAAGKRLRLSGVSQNTAEFNPNYPSAGLSMSPAPQARRGTAR